MQNRLRVGFNQVVVLPQKSDDKREVKHRDEDVLKKLITMLSP